MNPPAEGLGGRAATSPALFNRWFVSRVLCLFRSVLNWFGDWSDDALFQVGKELTHALDIDIAGFTAPDTIPIACKSTTMPLSYRDTLVNAFVAVHQSIFKVNERLKETQGKSIFITPRHYLDFIHHFIKSFNEKRDDLEEQQRCVCSYPRSRTATLMSVWRS
jgi:dynein heavy chain 1